jgi:hypothetical protein
MCIKCGDLEHYDNTLIQKAINSGLKEKPRFKVISLLESQFKTDFVKNMTKSLSEIKIQI